MMFGRQISTSLLRLPRCTRLPVRPLPFQPADQDNVTRALAPLAARFYAQITPSRPGRPKKAVGEPSRPVKRDVKRAAKSPKEGAAAKKVTARKDTAQKKKKAAAKPKPKKRALSDEQKAKRKADKAKAVQLANISELKRLALKAPSVSRSNAWSTLVKERMRDTKLQPSSGQSVNAAFAERMKNIREEYGNFTPAQVEHYNHLARTNREKSLADYKQWVVSHSVEDIEVANKARRSLRLKLKANKGQAAKWPAIKDERAVKRPNTAFVQFSINRFASGDFRHIAVKDASKLVGQEWKTLSDAEKRKYQSLYQQDAGRYNDEYTSVHGHAPPQLLGTQGAETAAAAA